MGDDGQFDIDVQDGNDYGEWLLDDDGNWQIFGDCCDGDDPEPGDPCDCCDGDPPLRFTIQFAGLVACTGMTEFWQECVNAVVAYLNMGLFLVAMLVHYSSPSVRSVSKSFSPGRTP